MKAKLTHIILGAVCLVAALVVPALWPDIVFYGKGIKGNLILDAAGFALLYAIIGVLGILEGIFSGKKK